MAALTLALTGFGDHIRRLALLVLWLAAPVALAQVDATEWRSGTVNLNRSWREHDGDNAAWAQTSFDDSQWTTVELNNGAATPGWRWYRLRVKLAEGHPHLHLLFAGGEGTYELYVNGERVAGPELRSLFGAKRPTEQEFLVRDEDTSLEIALRTYTPTGYVVWGLPLFLTVVLGTPEAIDNQGLAMESQRLYVALPAIGINLVLLLAGLAAFALYRSQRRHSEYLWLGLYLFLLGASNLLLACSSTGIIGLGWNNLLADPLVYVITIMQIEFTFSFVGQRVGRVWRVYEAVLLAPIVLAVLATTGRFLSSRYFVIEALAILPAALLLPARLFVWARRGNREAGWLIVPSLLPAATMAMLDLGSASLYRGWGWADFLASPIPVGPVPLQLADLGDLLFVLTIGVVMFFRFTRVSREQARSKAELDAAREIQRRLVPEQLPEIAGYTIEAAYFPAEEVGGDFYQVLNARGGAKLVVVGDVSGKGLKAAMTGALAMGALRALATEGMGPAALLMRLNRQLAETRDEGFITCVCAQVSEQGDVTIANAGHLPPYRNGEEMLLEPDLPLGIWAEEKYAEHGFRLEPGDRLTLLSDGVVEARDARGVLFGFDRTRAISAEAASVIAAAALEFGQEDDITVLTLTRVSGEWERVETRAGAVMAGVVGLG
jgi:hypothetical protein